VPSGEAGLRALREGATTGDPFDLAIVDFHMPGMNGLTVANTIALDDTLRDTRVVMLTSSAAAITAEDRKLAKVAATLSKPVHETALYAALVKVMGRVDQGGGDSVAASALGQSMPKGLRVLVAEDNPTNQLVVRRVLEKLGYEPDVVGDGQQALDALAAREYAAVLMDCQMPNLDGFDATCELRRREGGGRHTPVIALTAAAMAGDRDRCLAVGMDDFVTKPVLADRLKEVLEQWTSGLSALPT
jgi:CheY-like chemotaxis protein